MAELYTSRMQCTPGKQKTFLEQIFKCISIQKTALLLGCSERTLRDWRREKFLMSYSAAKKLAKETNVKVPPHTIRTQHWHTKTAAKKGGNATWNKYKQIGDSKIRKEKWQDWWQNEGRHDQQLHVNKTLPFHMPKYSKELAEFCGIMLGDGGISKRQFTITLHLQEKQYAAYVSSLIQKLFLVTPSQYTKQKNTRTVCISRTKLVTYLEEYCGLESGNKVINQVSVPLWILESRPYQKACLRGLFDTDGSIYMHRYTSKGKKYEYQKIGFSSRSQSLLEDVHAILTTFNIKSRITPSEVKIEAQKDVRRFLRQVGFSNTKHLKRIQK